MGCSKCGHYMKRMRAQFTEHLYQDETGWILIKLKKLKCLNCGNVEYR